jgi:hypothetical protein
VIYAPYATELCGFFALFARIGPAASARQGAMAQRCIGSQAA